MKSGYNQPPLMKNNNNQINSLSGKKSIKMNIDNNLNSSDSEGENNETVNKITNYKNIKKNSIMTDDEYKKKMNERIKKFNLPREKIPDNKINMKNSNSNNINNTTNFSKGYSEEINNKPLFKGNSQLLNTNYSNDRKRSFSGEKNFKPMVHFYNAPIVSDYNHINRITTSYNSKKRNIKNMQSN